jgi:hypothetical protein
MVSFIQFGSRPPLYHARLINVFPSPKVKGLAGPDTKGGCSGTPFFKSRKAHKKEP